MTECIDGNGEEATTGTDMPRRPHDEDTDEWDKGQEETTTELETFGVVPVLHMATSIRYGDETKEDEKSSRHLSTLFPRGLENILALML